MTQKIWVDSKNCDHRAFRTMLGSFMSGVTVVATREHDGNPRAFTANSFTSVSLEPALVLVCLAKSASSYDVFTKATTFSISVLGDWQRNLSNAFASRGPAKDEALAHLAGNAIPYVDDSLATMLCSRHQVVDAGDHIILLGHVTQFMSSVGQPLGYFRGGYVGFGLATRQLEQLGVPLVVGGLLEWQGKVALCRRPGAPSWEVPASPLSAGQHHNQLLAGLFGRFGIAAEASFLYSIFQEQGERYTSMVFLVESTAADVVSQTLEDGTEVRFFGVEDEPWTLIQSEMNAGMLKRFFRERAAGRFGIYCDTPDGGKVAALGGSPKSWSEWSPEQPEQTGI